MASGTGSEDRALGIWIESPAGQPEALSGLGAWSRFRCFWLFFIDFSWFSVIFEHFEPFGHGWPEAQAALLCLGLLGYVDLRSSG